MTIVSNCLCFMSPKSVIYVNFWAVLKYIHVILYGMLLHSCFMQQYRFWWHEWRKYYSAFCLDDLHTTVKFIVFTAHCRIRIIKRLLLVYNINTPLPFLFHYFNREGKHINWFTHLDGIWGKVTMSNSVW